MFGFNKKKRLIEGPVEFTAEVQIDRPAEEVFPLVDVTDPRFKETQMGAKVAAAEGSANRYELTMDGMDDVTFHFTVLEREIASHIKLEAVIEPQINALEKSLETKVIEHVSDTACLVKSTTIATFDADLTDEEVASEIAVMNEAVMGDLEKLKILAEDGLDALMEAQEAEMSFDIEFDLGELDIDWDDIEPEQ